MSAAFVATTSGIKVQLPRWIRDAIVTMMHEFSETVTDPDEAASRVLRPVGYPDDITREYDFRELVDDGIERQHLNGARYVIETAHDDTLDDEAQATWLRTLNVARVTLASQHGWDTEDADRDHGDPAARARYDLLGALVSELLRAS